MLIYAHADCAAHLTPPGHPERVERLGAVMAGLTGVTATRRDCPMGDEADVLRCHPASYLAKVKAAVPGEGWVSLDADTHLSPGSYVAAMRAVGGACAAVDAVLAGEAKTAFVACRPPGHHAETATAMGFCLFGTVAIAARRAIEVHGVSRIAVVDFDVHHGNGTQDLLWTEDRCLFVSSHQMPLYPGTGAEDETGAHGQMINVPLRAGSGSAGLRQAYEAKVFPVLRDWQPELILISAGFDAHRDDPLGGLGWETADYAWLTERICDATTGGRVVSTLEGGYDLEALTASVAVHAAVLEARG